jgi:hypothetical protein
MPTPPNDPSMSSRSSLASRGGKNSLCGSSSATSPAIADWTIFSLSTGRT